MAREPGGPRGRLEAGPSRSASRSRSAGSTACFCGSSSTSSTARAPCPSSLACSCRGGRVVIATFDRAHIDGFWLTRFFPSIAEIDARRFPEPDALAGELEAVGFRRTSVSRSSSDTLAVPGGRARADPGPLHLDASTRTSRRARRQAASRRRASFQRTYRSSSTGRSWSQSALDRRRPPGRPARRRGRGVRRRTRARRSGSVASPASRSAPSSARGSLRTSWRAARPRPGYPSPVWSARLSGRSCFQTRRSRWGGRSSAWWPSGPRGRSMPWAERSSAPSSEWPSRGSSQSSRSSSLRSASGRTSRSPRSCPGSSAPCRRTTS